MTNLILVTTTTGSREEAELLSQELLTRKLVACVQIYGPVTSQYWWKGDLETSTEWLCTAKTLAEKYADVESAIRTRHSYDEPEIIAVEITHASPGYQQWLESAVDPHR